MPSNWTWSDPGAGDVGSCGLAARWAELRASDLSDARAAVTTILRDLDASWTGESADAFRGRAAGLRRDLEDSAEAMDAARKAVIEYGDVVAEIAARAEPLKQDLAAAQLILDMVSEGALFDNDAAGMEYRLQAERQATIDARTVTAALAELAKDRATADQTLASLLGRVASAAWGGLRCVAESPEGSRRDKANRRVMEMLGQFWRGDLGRGAALGPDDPFVSTLMRSDHIESVRERVLADLRSGTLTSAEEDSYDRSISNNPSVLVNDGVNLATSAMSGPLADFHLDGQNLPESFLGSYSLEVFAGDPRPDGGVEVTYVMNNETTTDSATRIPGTGGGHLPIVHPSMLAAEVDSGEWAPQHQTIVWTETVYP
ncbi:WXG100 family type VII secretion target [Microbacterium sp. Leaf320]|uniref:WXG100 family type VII secretion target n=1 Tax=Microbacterium sp. Leaf320 TaxID=1736334 RepID=UPI0006F96687|nr:hypothetical protein [Microbacterium sp. Leaf320]KQQ67416.1 hypothetical protein ASF63_09550 [Microbacterium sp. Leaf320]